MAASPLRRVLPASLPRCWAAVPSCSELSIDRTQADASQRLAAARPSAMPTAAAWSTRRTLPTTTSKSHRRHLSSLVEDDQRGRHANSTTSDSHHQRSRTGKSYRAGRRHHDAYRLPPGPLDLKIRYVLSIVPKDRFTPEIANFCIETSNRLGQQQTSTALHRAQSLLVRLEQDMMVADTNPHTTRIDTRRLPPLTPTPYNRLLRAWARCTDATPQSKIQQARNLWQHMKDQHIQHPNLCPAPDDYTHLALLFVYSRASKEATCIDLLHDIATQAQSLVDALEQEGPQGNLPKAYYDALIEVYANQSSHVYGAAASAEDVLVRLSSLSTKSTTTSAAPDTDATFSSSLTPDTRTFNRVLQAWSVCREETGADRAHQILKLQLSLGVPATPDVISFGTVIAAFGRRNRPKEAEQVWRSCVHYFEGDQQSGDLTGCFQATVAAWSQSTSDQAAIQIQSLLASVQSLDTVRDEAIAHACYIRALLQQAKLQQAHDHLQKMIDNSQHGLSPIPTTSTFHDVLRGWSQSGRHDRAEQATQLLEQMLSLDDPTCSADLTAFRIVLELCCDVCTSSDTASHANDNAEKLLMKVLEYAGQRRQVDAFLYMRVINSLCRRGTQNAVFHACDVLDRYADAADASSSWTWIPKQSIGLYTAVIASLARLRTPDAAERALAVFTSIPRTGKRAMEPTMRTYTSLLQAFAILGNPRSCQVAADLFPELKRLDADQNHKLSLDDVIFAVLMEASVCDANLCTDIFRYMLDLFHSGRQDLKPTERCQKALVKAQTRGGQAKHDVDMILRNFDHFRLKEIDRANLVK